MTLASTGAWSGSILEKVSVGTVTTEPGMSRWPLTRGQSGDLGLAAMGERVLFRVLGNLWLLGRDVCATVPRSFNPKSQPRGCWGHTLLFQTITECLS